MRIIPATPVMLSATPRVLRAWPLLVAVALLWSVRSPHAGGTKHTPEGGRDAARPPNIVFIMADDLGYGDLGAYGQARIRTPRLDEMAAQGTRFTQFYAGSTVCAPSRSTLMTGRHTGHTLVRGNPANVTPALRLERGVDFPLPDSVETLAESLRRAGYVTAGFGKWGLGGAGTTGAPLVQGFDRFFGYLSHIAAHYYYPEYLWEGNRQVPLPGNTQGGAGTYSHDVIAQEALRFIERHRDQPFFLYLPFTIPHSELRAPQDAYAPYRNADGSSIFPEEPYEPSDQQRGFRGLEHIAQPMPHATYAAMITRMDRDVGRILDKLRELGLADNTVVFFTSDNGPSREGGSDPAFFGSSGGLRGIKRDLYEGGIRVPMIAWGPGKVPGGRVSDQVWALWDVLPTLAEIAGTEPPSGTDGISLLPALLGRSGQAQHPYLYWEFPESGGKQAVRLGDWKGVRLDVMADAAAPVELYDLRTDPAEKRDVAGEHPDVVRSIREIMRSSRTESEIWPLIAAQHAAATAANPSIRAP